MSQSNRIVYIDSAKAIAILLVIIGHCYWLKDIPKLGGLIYSFHMPLFFLISGFFIKDIGINIALKKYSKAYLWPYLMIGLFLIIIGIIKSLVHKEDWYSLVPLNIAKILWGSNYESDVLFGSIPHIGPSWFLLALFWGCLFMSMMGYIKTSTEKIALILIMVCYSVCSSKVVKMPVSLQGGGICVAYIYIGNLIRKHNILPTIFSLPLYLKLLAFILWFLTVTFLGGIDIGSGNLGYSVVGFVVSLVGSFFVLNFCERTDIKFGWIGRNTLCILCAHILVGPFLGIFDIRLRELPFSPYLNFIMEVTIDISLALLLGWLISKSHLLEYKQVKTMFNKKSLLKEQERSSK